MEYLDTYSDILDSSYNQKLFLICCKEDKIDLIKWILQYDYKLDISDYGNMGYYIACESNNLDIAKWLYNKSPDNNIDDTEYIFEVCCKNGYNKLFSWMLENNKNNLDNFNFDALFYLCIYYKNYDTAKIIFNYYKNLWISRDNDFLFRDACSNNNIELVKLLLYIRPGAYFINIIDDKIIHYEIISSLIIKNNILEKELDNLRMCCICYGKSNVYTSCKHFYCYNCLEKYYYHCDNNNNMLCPYCRNLINEWNLYNIK